MRRRVAALLLAVAVVTAGCGGEQERRAEVLDEVVTATFDGPVAFNLELDADEGELAAFGAAAGPLAQLLAGSSVAGVLDGDRVAFGLRLGDVDALQARYLGPGEVYVRVDLQGLAELVLGEGSDLEVELRRALRREGLEQDAVDGVLAAARGEWVRLVTATADGGSSDDPAGRTLTTVLRAALAAATPTGHIGDLDAQPFDGQLTVTFEPTEVLRGLAEAFGEPTVADELDEPVADGVLTARLTVTGGVVRAVLIDAEAVLEEVSGAELVLDLRQLGVQYGQLVQAPATAVQLTVEQLEAAAAVLPQLEGDAG